MITKYFSLPRESTVSPTLWQNCLIFSKHGLLLNFQVGSLRKWKDTSENWIKNGTTWALFQASHPTLDESVTDGSGYLCQMYQWLTWGPGGRLDEGCPHGTQPLPQPAVCTSWSHCCLHNLVRLCEAKLISVCVVLGMCGQPLKGFLLKTDSG